MLCRQSPNTPSQRRNGEHQEGNRGLESERDREVVPPPNIAVLAQQRGGVSVVVVHLDVVNAKEVVSRNDLRQRANAGSNKTQESGRLHLHPAHVRCFQRRMLEVVSSIDE